MTTYLTQESAQLLAMNYCGELHGNKLHMEPNQIHAFCNAAIQAYRENLVAGVVLPEPYATLHHDDGHYTTKQREHDLRYGGPFRTDVYTADQLRQAIADDRVLREPDYEHSETYLRKTSEVDALAKQVPDLESRDFYELMQAYRHARIDAAKPFEAVKAWLRKPTYEWDSQDKKQVI